MAPELDARVVGGQVQDAVGYEHRAAADVEYPAIGTKMAPDLGRDEVVPHFMAVLVVLAPDIELLLDGRDSLVVVPGERGPVGRAQQVELGRGPGTALGAVTGIDGHPKGDQ